MTKSKKIKTSPCFIPLSLSSQSNSECVLYYNAEASPEDIYECATARLQSVINLLENLHVFTDCEPEAVSAVASVSAFLLNDAMSLLEELNPIAIGLRNQLPEN